MPQTGVVLGSELGAARVRERRRGSSWGSTRRRVPLARGFSIHLFRALAGAARTKCRPAGWDVAGSR